MNPLVMAPDLLCVLAFVSIFASLNFEQKNNVKLFSKLVLVISLVFGVVV